MFSIERSLAQPSRRPAFDSCLALLCPGVGTQADPQLSSWFTANSAFYARVYQTTADRTIGTAVTTWSGHTSPAHSDIYEVLHSASWVYVRSTSLASHVMGPWLNPQGGQFVYWPATQGGLRRFPRSATITIPAATTKTSTTGGYCGLYMNGVAVFNAVDGQAWTGTAIKIQGIHTSSTYCWHRNATAAEVFNFANAIGHLPPTGAYHTHQLPMGLRHQLGDHVKYNPTTEAYTERTSAPAPCASPATARKSPAAPSPPWMPPPVPTAPSCA